MNITATATTARNGKRTIVITHDGVEVYTRSTKAAYTHILIQGWEGKENVAYRFSSSAKPLGTKIEYGRVVAVIPIEQA